MGAGHDIDETALRRRGLHAPVGTVLPLAARGTGARLVAMGAGRA
jgi:hypothetical protein